MTSNYQRKLRNLQKGIDLQCKMYYNGSKEITNPTQTASNEGLLVGTSRNRMESVVMWTYEQMKPYDGTKVTVKNVDNYLHMFDIEKLGTDTYKVPENTVTYQEDAEAHGFDIIDLSELEVEQGDTLVVWAVKHVSPVRSVLEVHNEKNGTTGYIEAYYGSDDARYYLCNSIAEYFKDKDVTVENYLYYNKEHVANYIHGMFNL